MHEELSNIRLVATDCDGVLTDGGMFYTANGDVMKRFNVLDGMGFIRLQQIGISTAIITSENTPIVQSRADKLQINYLIQGTKDKKGALKSICSEMKIDIKQACYIGDDLFDLPAIQACGFGCAPPNALQDVIVGADYVTTRMGGDGCFREVAEMIIKEAVKCERKSEIEQNRNI